MYNSSDSIATSCINHLHNYYLKKEDMLTHAVCKYRSFEAGFRIKFSRIRCLLAVMVFLVSPWIVPFGFVSLDKQRLRDRSMLAEQERWCYMKEY